MTGDLGDAAIHDFVKRYEGAGLLDVDAHVVGHHGSANGTTPELVAAIRPQVAVVSMGRQGRPRRCPTAPYV